MCMVLVSILQFKLYYSEVELISQREQNKQIILGDSESDIPKILNVASDGVIPVIYLPLMLPKVILNGPTTR